MANYSYLGMDLRVSDSDTINTEYFAHCASGQYALQTCDACKLMRYPPSAGCPWCGNAGYQWKKVSGRGTVYSYSEVTHAVQPGFAKHTPYMVLLVELDEQRGAPTADDGIRVLGNLAKESGELATPDEVAKVGIGSRMRMVFTKLDDKMAIPQWTLEKDSPAGWRPPV